MPLFRRAGDLYVPTEATGGPWSLEAQHGGPPAGLLAHLASEALGDDATSLHPARLTVDLFRPVPLTPLRGQAEVVRRGRRLALVRTSLADERGPLANATVLFLATRDGEEDSAVTAEGVAAAERSAERPVGPDGIQGEPMVPRDLFGLVPPGFHFEVEVRWSRWRAAPAAWIRMPMPLLEDRPITAFERIATLADFANATSSVARRARGSGYPFINVDSTLYLFRLPIGEWCCLAAEQADAHRGLAVHRVAVFDQAGPIGTILQAALLQSETPAGQAAHRIVARMGPT